MTPSGVKGPSAGKAYAQLSCGACASLCEGTEEVGYTEECPSNQGHQGHNHALAIIVRPLPGQNINVHSKEGTRLRQSRIQFIVLVITGASLFSSPFI